MNTISPIALAITHIALAGGVTVHVLLYKREIGSAAAWIGLAWLAPIYGSFLYWLLGINRVRRRARWLREARLLIGRGIPLPLDHIDDPLSSLERTGQRISQRKMETGNTLTLLRGGDEAYARMITAIDSAYLSVALSSYLFRADAAGRLFIDALLRARDRGVELRVLIDGVGGDYFHSAVAAELKQAGVPVARFLHSSVPWRMPFVNLRNHRKILGVDGRLAFTGGLNIGAENLALPTHRAAVVDTHFMIQGPVVAQLIEVFSEDWNFTTGERLTGDTWFPVLIAAGETRARVITSGPDQEIDRIELLILEGIGSARRSIKIMTPYFLPDERLTTALVLAAYRGVEVDVILPEHSNHPAVDWAARAQLGPLLAADCRVWTHPAPFDHSKLMTIDGLWCLIGSANWDMRSFRLNFEVDVEIFHAVLADEINTRIGAAQGTRLTAEVWAARSLSVRLRDSAARLLQPYL